MKFLVILAALAIERFSTWHLHLHRDDWFAAWRTRVAGWSDNPAVQVVIALTVPLAGLYLVLHLVEGLWFGLPELLVSVIVLFYALGRGRVDHRLADYLADWLRGDHQAAWYTVEDWLEHDGGPLPESAIALHQAVRRAYLGRLFYGLFVPVFWFFLLGPLAALACVLLHLWVTKGASGPATRLAARLRNLLGYPPAWLFAASCALVGSYGGAARVLVEDFGRSGTTALGTAERAALAALEGERADGAALASVKSEALREFQELQALCGRCLVLVLVLVALATIFGWN